MEKETLAKKKEKKIGNILIKETEMSLKSKKKKKFKRLTLLFLNACFLILLCWFGVKVASVLIITPILSVYGTAANFYALAGDDSLFKYVSPFAKRWLYSLIMLALAIIGFRITKKKLIGVKKDE